MMPLLQACTTQSALFAHCTCLQCLRLPLYNTIDATYDVLQHGCGKFFPRSHNDPVRISSDHFPGTKEQADIDFDALDFTVLQSTGHFDLVQEADCLLTAPQTLRSEKRASRDVSEADFTACTQTGTHSGAPDDATSCDISLARTAVIRVERREQKLGHLKRGLICPEMVSLTSDNPEKKPCSYSKLITHALLSSRAGRLTLSEIYNWCLKEHPYFARQPSDGWKNSIRHNLSLNKSFVKIARPIYEPGKGAYWALSVQPVRCKERD